MTDTLPAAAGSIAAERKQPRVALIGNPNTGKTSLFNRITGLRCHTANYPGITVDVRRGRWNVNGTLFELSDLPGLYSLDALSPEETVARNALTGQLAGETVPDAVVIVVDATSIERNLFLVSEILDLRLPTIVALNLIDAARADAISIDTEQLSHQLGCPVIPVSAKTGEGIRQLGESLRNLTDGSLPMLTDQHTSCTAGCSGCTFAARYNWAEATVRGTVDDSAKPRRPAAAIDRILTNAWMGPIAFLALMLGVFYLIFSLASVPMDLVDGLFGTLGGLAGRLIPNRTVMPATWFGAVAAASLLTFAAAYRLARVGWSWKSAPPAVLISLFVATLPIDEFRSLLVDGVIAGIGGVVIFLPQICILFFAISLLEDSGYMARAAFVMERLMRFVGLPGKAFVPMLSAHACAIPGIMAARVIENRRDRLVTILVLPMLTCSARLPVYSMVAALLFSDSPAMAATVFTGAYVLGIVATLLTAWLLKKSILKGDSEPLVLELPPYRRPALRNAVLTVIDRARVFLRKAGTVILMISVALWALANYPRLDESRLPAETALEVATLRNEAAGQDKNSADTTLARVDQILGREQLAHSVAGYLGHFVEPVFRPLGFDWKINVGIISSFAAREVIVSTLAIVYGIGADASEDKATLIGTLRRQKKPDGTPVFTTATCLSLLVFFVLAMQCLPTQAVTRRETGSWKWAILQLGYMTALAYVAALITYQTAAALGV